METILMSDIGGWMQTLQGNKFWPLKPQRDHLDILDIGGALAKMCRYGGHCKRFYSVAEHCVLVAHAASEQNKLAALMHDASEAYLVDIPSPLKRFIPGYHDMEARLMAVIADKFKFEWPLPDEVKQLDRRILRDERIQNMERMPVPPEQWGDTLDGLGIQLQYWSPDVAMEKFLNAFHRYNK